MCIRDSFLAQEFGEAAIAYTKAALRRHRIAKGEALHEATGDALPHGFWQQFLRNELRLDYNTAQRLRAYRSWMRYVERINDGNNTREAMRGDRPRGSKRNNGAARNAQNA